MDVEGVVTLRKMASENGVHWDGAAVVPTPAPCQQYTTKALQDAPTGVLVRLTSNLSQPRSHAYGLRGVRKPSRNFRDSESLSRKRSAEDELLPQGKAVALELNLPAPLVLSLLQAAENEHPDYLAEVCGGEDPTFNCRACFGHAWERLQRGVACFNNGTWVDACSDDDTTEDATSDTLDEAEEHHNNGGHTRQPPPRRPRSKPAAINGPCDHCNATDSPQWRKGPKSKPCLCNACGTRYSRTKSLTRPADRKGGPRPTLRRHASVESDSLDTQDADQLSYAPTRSSSPTAGTGGGTAGNGCSAAPTAAGSSTRVGNTSGGASAGVSAAPAPLCYAPTPAHHASEAQRCSVAASQSTAPAHQPPAPSMPSAKLPSCRQLAYEEEASAAAPPLFIKTSQKSSAGSAVAPPTAVAASAAAHGSPAKRAATEVQQDVPRSDALQAFLRAAKMYAASVNGQDPLGQVAAMLVKSVSSGDSSSATTTMGRLASAPHAEVCESRAMSGDGGGPDPAEQAAQQQRWPAVVGGGPVGGEGEPRRWPAVAGGGGVQVTTGFTMGGAASPRNAAAGRPAPWGGASGVM